MLNLYSSFVLYFLPPLNYVSQNFKKVSHVILEAQENCFILFSFKKGEINLILTL